MSNELHSLRPSTLMTCHSIYSLRPSTLMTFQFNDTDTLTHIIHADIHIKIDEISNELNINYGSAFLIIHK